MSPTPLRCPLPYFGGVALWRAATHAGGFAFLRAEHYQRRSERNRLRIATAQGAHALSVPLRAGKHEACPADAVAIDYATDWPRRHFLTLRAAYGSAPLWTEYADALEALYATRPAMLWDWNLACVRWANARLRTPLPIAVADDWSAADAEALPRASEVPPAPYPQVFADRHGFIAGLGIVDLLLCRGPAATEYLAAAPG